MNMHHHNERFDAAMRTLHQDALAQVSPQVRWKLRPAIAAQDGGGRRVRAHRRWHMGTTFAGVAMAAALAAGLAVWQPHSITGADVQTRIAQADDVADTSATPLEQDPDFYAWLDTADADLVAVE